MSTTTEARPPQVTMAAWMVMVGSVAVVLTVWEQISGLRSLETRQAIESILDGPVAGGLGLDVEGMIRVLHLNAMVAAGCATAAAVLGWHVLKRNLAARLVLSILAVPLFVSGLATGGFMSSLVAAAAAMLWISPAREWFRTGRWTPPATPAQVQAQASRHTGQPDAPTGASALAPPPHPAPYAAPVAPARPEMPARPGAASRPPLSARPTALVSAFVVTVVSASLVLALVGLSVLVVVFAPDLVMTELERQRPELTGGVDQSELRASAFLLGAVCLAWCGTALTFAGFAMAGRPWARTALSITAAATAGVSLLSILYLPLAVLPGLAAVLTTALLRRREVRAWFDGAPRDGMSP